jgi:hypothetical protein
LAPLPLIASLLKGAGVGEAIGRLRRHLLLTAAITAAAFAGGGMLTAGGFLYLAEAIGAPAAAVTAGAGLLAVAGLLALTGQVRRRTMMRATAQPAEAAPDVPALLAAVEAAIRRDARSEMPLFALAALLAGCAVASPQVREVLMQACRSFAPPRDPPV